MNRIRGGLGGAEALRLNHEGHEEFLLLKAGVLARLDCDDFARIWEGNGDLRSREWRGRETGHSLEDT